MIWFKDTGVFFLLLFMRPSHEELVRANGQPKSDICHICRVFTWKEHGRCYSLRFEPQKFVETSFHRLLVFFWHHSKNRVLKHCFFQFSMFVMYVNTSMMRNFGFRKSSKNTLGALTIWMEFSVIPGRIQMERFIPPECFRKKGYTFRGIPFFSLSLVYIWRKFFTGFSSQMKSAHNLSASSRHIKMKKSKNINVAEGN